MVRALRAPLRVGLAWRIIAPVLALALVLGGTPAEPATAGGRSLVATIRSDQLRTEATMLRADKQIKRLRAQRKHRAKRHRQARRTLARWVERRDRARLRLTRARARLELAEQVLARTLRVHPDPSGRQVTDKPKLRARVRKLERREAGLERQARQAQRAVKRSKARVRRASQRVTTARIERRLGARERAEGKLAAQISQMLALSKERASARFSAATRNGFSRPARGRVSQRFGCTGYRANPRVGSCRHFHDGIDIATPRGTRVRAAADGYVAYVGRNPWDRGRRAFVVIIGHARGYETVYAHLKPARLVRAGQRVRRGQVIGVVGLTGHTSGPHVHWEVKQGGRAVDPRRAGR